MDPISMTLLGLSAAQGIYGLWGSSEQASDEKRMAAYEANAYEKNADMRDRQAEDVLARGEKESSLVRRKGRQLLGSQRAALAAQGIEIDTGSAGMIQAETEEMTELDVMTAKNNAWREAMGLKFEAEQGREKAQLARQGGANKARNTLITGGMQAVESGIKGYARYKGY